VAILYSFFQPITVQNANFYRVGTSTGSVLAAEVIPPPADGEFTSGETIDVGGQTAIYGGAYQGGILFTISGNIFYAGQTALSTGNIDRVIIDGAIAAGVPSPSFCFLKGTRIETPRGFVSIEELKVGDLIETDLGPVPVKFVGRTSGTLLPLELSGELPVLIKAHAFGAGLPATDLYVSPGHAILLEGSLIHASVLVNGRTVIKTTSADWPSDRLIEYYNIEFDTHRIIYAEGLAAESFLDIIPRKVLDNFDDYLDLYGEEQPIMELPLPRIQHQRQLPIKLAERVGVLQPAA
jgi:hypothetical protein